jgi:nitrogen regulatory protein PII
MHFKLIIALVDDSKTSAVVEAARKAGATGATILGDARGEGLKPRKTFFGLTMEASRDMLMFIVEEHLSRFILECIADVGGFQKRPGSGVAFQLDIEDAIGMDSQINSLIEEVEERL